MTADLPDIHPQIAEAAMTLAHSHAGEVGLIVLRVDAGGRTIVDFAGPTNAHDLELMALSILRLAQEAAPNGNPDCPDCATREARCAAALTALGGATLLLEPLAAAARVH